MPHKITTCVCTTGKNVLLLTKIDTYLDFIHLNLLLIYILISTVFLLIF
jgi:hypothetical protein